jgi:hypothetical protein
MSSKAKKARKRMRKSLERAATSIGPVTIAAASGAIAGLLGARAGRAVEWLTAKLRQTADAHTPATTASTSRRPIDAPIASGI